MSSKAKTCVYILGGSLARYTAVKRRLTAAGYATKSGAGYGAYGTEMVLTSATETEAKAALKDATFVSSLRYGTPLSPVNLK